MKKNIFKKIVASLATVAMAAGMFAAKPAEEVKAAEGTDKTIYLVVDKNDTNRWAMHMWSGMSTNATTTDIGWGENNKKPELTKVQDGLLKINVTIWDDLSAEKDNGLQFVKFEEEGKNTGDYKACANDGDNKKAYWSDVYAALAGSQTEVWLALDADKWTIKTTSPVEIKKTDAEFAAEAEAVIDVAIALDATKANKTKYDAAKSAYNALSDAQKALVDSAKVTKLNAGVKAIEDILAAEKAAEDAKYTGKITIYAKVPASWAKVSLYGWTIDGDHPIFGGWPGDKKLNPLKNNAGWYSCTFNTTEPVGVIFNNDGNKEQTGDWKKMLPGTYWVDFSKVEGQKDGENMKYAIDDSNVSTKAPSGWKDEAAQEVVTQAPTTTPAPTTTKPAVDKGSVASKADVEKIDKEAVVEGAPADAKLDATEIAADSDAFKVVKEAAKTAFKNKTYVALDLKLLKGTETVQANGDVKVTIPVPTALAKSTKVAVYRVGDDNKLVSCGTADVANGKITFTTNHFSTYVFADASVSANKPGDAAPIVLMLAVAAVAAGMVVASKKKTICE